MRQSQYYLLIYNKKMTLTHYQSYYDEIPELYLGITTDDALFDLDFDSFLHTIEEMQRQIMAECERDLKKVNEKVTILSILQERK